MNQYINQKSKQSSKVESVNKKSLRGARGKHMDPLLFLIYMI
jgi:hypothetical protein